MMNAKQALKIMLGQLALEEPMAFAGAAEQGKPGLPLVELVQAAVDEEFALAAVEGGDEAEAIERVWRRLSRTAEILSRAVAPLWISMVVPDEVEDQATLMETRTEAQVAADYSRYVDALSALANAAERWLSRLQRLPVMPRVSEELTAMAGCMGLLLHRRSILRRLIHPNVCQYTGSESGCEAGADRADEILAFYEVVRAGRAECPQNWTLRNDPDSVENAITLLLMDLHHLADVSEVSWSAMVAKAQRFYESALSDRRS